MHSLEVGLLVIADFFWIGDFGSTDQEELSKYNMYQLIEREKTLAFIFVSKKKRPKSGPAHRLIDRGSFLETLLHLKGN